METPNSANSNIFTGKEKYTAGLIILLGSLINYFINMGKYKYNRSNVYMILIIIIITADLMAHI